MLGWTTPFRNSTNALGPSRQLNAAARFPRSGSSSGISKGILLNVSRRRKCSYAGRELKPFLVSSPRCSTVSTQESNSRAACPLTRCDAIKTPFAASMYQERAAASACCQPSLSQRRRNPGQAEARAAPSLNRGGQDHSPAPSSKSGRPQCCQCSPSALSPEYSTGATHLPRAKDKK